MGIGSRVANGRRFVDFEEVLDQMKDGAWLNLFQDTGYLASVNSVSFYVHADASRSLAWH